MILYFDVELFKGSIVQIVTNYSHKFGLLLVNPRDRIFTL